MRPDLMISGLILAVALDDDKLMLTMGLEGAGGPGAGAPGGMPPLTLTRAESQ